MKIIPYQTRYQDQLYEVCLKTGDDGQNGEHLHNDRQILGHIYVGPYLELAPEFALVLLDDAGQGVGYCLGALDSIEFFRRAAAQWFPKICQKYAAAEPQNFTQRDLECLKTIQDYHSYNCQQLYEYPSHLHINLLPEAQGKGMGRALIEEYCGLLAAAGSVGVHLITGVNNHKAGDFYQRIGFCDFKHNEQNGRISGRIMVRKL